MKAEHIKENSKHSRKRKILSCFRCRYLRNKCDRAKPKCGRCVENACDSCEYMSDSGSRDEYIKHLKSTGHTDNRIKVVDDLPSRKVRFEVPDTPQSTSKPINKEITNLLYRAAMDLKKPVNKENLSYISILDKSITKKQSIDWENENLSLNYTAQIFNDSTGIINKIFVNDRTPGSNEPLRYKVAAKSPLCLEQIYLRLLPPQIKSMWKNMAMDYFQQIDLKKYSRLSLQNGITNSKFLDNWQFEKSNMFEDILKALPKEIDVLQTIIFEFFNTEFHKTFKILNESNVKKMFSSIFKFDKKTRIINEIHLEEDQDQFYLGIIVLLFQFMIDPELYYDPIFKKIDDIVSDLKPDRHKHGYLKCQYCLLTLFKSEMQSKASFTTNRKTVNDMLGWAEEIENVHKDGEVLDPQEQEIIDNVWCWIMYFDVLAYIELGIFPRFSYHFTNDASLKKCERGRMPLIKKLALLVGKICMACEHPSFNPDIDYLCQQIDEFIERNLAPIDYYMDAQRSKKIDAFDFNILNPLLCLKISFVTYKFALTTNQIECNELKNQLFGLCFASETVCCTQQAKILIDVKNIKVLDSINFDKHLKSLKKHEKLEENQDRPTWVPQLIAPNFMMFCNNVLNDRALSIIEFATFASLKEFFNSTDRNSLHCEDKIQFNENLISSLIYYGLGKTNEFKDNYTPMDIIVLHDRLAHNSVETIFKLPTRIYYPGRLFLEFLYSFEGIMQQIQVNDDEEFTYDQVPKAYEMYKVEKKKLKKIEENHSNENGQKDTESTIVFPSPDNMDLNELWFDMQDFDIMDFMKSFNL